MIFLMMMLSKKDASSHMKFGMDRKSKNEAAQTAYKLSVALSRLMIPHTVPLLTTNSCTQGPSASAILRSYRL